VERTIPLSYILVVVVGQVICQPSHCSLLYEMLADQRDQMQSQEVTYSSLTNGIGSRACGCGGGTRGGNRHSSGSAVIDRGEDHVGGHVAYADE
jgi:hypothetical protein